MNVKPVNSRGTAAARATRLLRLLAVCLIPALVTLLGVTEAVAQDMTEPERPANCGNDPGTIEPWQSVTSTSSSISVTFKDPMPSDWLDDSGSHAIQICYPKNTTVYGTQFLPTEATNPAAGTTYMISEVRNSLDFLVHTIQAETDYWISTGNYTNQSKWYYIRTKAASSNNAPVFTSQPTTASVAENSADGTAVVTVAATDADNDAIAYSLDTASDKVFDIDSSGNITVQVESGSALNHEGTSSYTTTVTANDGTDDATHDVTISVTDVNEPPGAPAAPTVTGASPTGVTVTWTAPANTGPAIFDYNVRFKLSTASTWTNHSFVSALTTTSIGSLTPGATYDVQVKAQSAEGQGPWSPTGSGATHTTITIAAGTSPVTEGTAATFTVTSNPAPSADVTVNLTVADASGSDFVAAGNEGSKTVTITASNTTATHSVPTTADTTDEPNGNVSVTVATGTGYTVGSTSSASVTVNDDDAPAQVPTAPAAPTVAGAFKTGLEVSWAAPASLGTGTAVTDYDLRYFAGTADPANEADWVEEGETKGPPNPGTSTSAIVTGLTKDQAYRVQVRAAAGHGESPWSASVSGTPANQAPRVLVEKNGVCRAATEAELMSPVDSIPGGGHFVNLVLFGRVANELTEFPADCLPFDDRDGDTMTFAVDQSLVPDNVRFTGNTPTVTGPRLFVQAFVPRQNVVNIDLGVTATDPDGLSSAKGLLRYQAGGFTGSATPSFSDTVAAQTWTQNAEITALTLPAAGGGDLEHTATNTTISWPYLYEAAGLPAGLSFDADTREIRGTPTATGSFTVTYTAQDADNDTSATDTASLTFAVTVRAPGTPTAGVTAGALVSNHGQADDGTASFANDLAQPFRTGRNTPGYKLTSVEVVGNKSTGSDPSYSVAIHGDSSNAPGTKVGDLSAPALTGSDDVIKFTASGSGLDLDAGTTYWLVIDNSTETTTAAIKRTSSNAEDAGKAAGWSIGDTRLFRGFGDTTWTSHTQPLEIGVHGSEKPGITPTAAAANGNTLTLTFDRSVTAVLDPTHQERGADGYGTVLERLGYTFSVSGAYRDGVRLRHVTPGPNRAAVSGSTVTLSLGDATFPPGSTNISVSYDVHFAATVGVALQDADGNAVGSFTRAVTNNTGGTVRPLLTAAQVAGTELTLTFDKALDAASAPAGNRFRVAVHPRGWIGESRFISGTGTATVSGSTVTVTLASAVEQDTTVQVAYDKPAANPLRDTAGAKPEVEEFWWVQATVLDRTAPKLHSSAFDINSGFIFLYYGEKLDTGSKPATSDFSLTVPGSNPKVREVVVTEDAVALIVSAASATMELSYTPGTNPIRDVAGNSAAKFLAMTPTGADASSAPSLERAETDGDLVTLTFDRALSPASVPAASAFAVRDLLAEQIPTGFDWTQDILSVAVRGKTVVLDVSPGIHVCAQARVSYTKPGENPLNNVANTAAAGFSDQDITHLRAGGCVFDAVRVASMDEPGASGDGRRLMSVQFDRPLSRSLPKKDSFTVTPRGGGAPIGIEDIRIPDDLTRLSLALSRPVSDGERLTLGYRPPRSGASLTDADGNMLAPFAAEVENGGTPAGATAAALVSDPGDDATYAAGDTVRVRLTFAGAVDVDTGGGTPRLKLDLDPADGEEDSGGRWAAYESGTGTNELVFAWAAVAPDESAAGIAVPADTLELNGGTIRLTGTQTGAALDHAGLAHDPAHKVDAVPPHLVRGEIDGGTMTLWFSEELDPASTGGRFDMSVQRSEKTTDRIGFRATGDMAVDGATVTVGMGKRKPRAKPGLQGGNRVRYSRLADGSDGPLRDLAGNPVLTPDRLSFASGKVWWYVRIDLENVTGGAPGVTGVAVASDAGGDDTYALGETIRVEVTFAEAVEVDTAGGTPRVKIKMDPRWGEFWADYASGGGTNALTFAYTVAEPNTAPSGIAVLADTLALNGGTIRSAATQAAARLSHDGLGHDAKHKVDWRTQPESGGEDSGGTGGDSGPPPVTGVAVVSDAGADDTYAFGETIRVRLTFGETVNASGKPRVKIKMDPRWGEFWAGYENGSGTNALTFAHTVAEPNYSTRGIAVLANTLALNGGKIRSAAGANAVLGHTGLDHDSGHKVDWRPAISVADARANEGADAAVVFEVSLDRAFTGAGHRVTVDYATADGSAKAGEDYTATTGTLTFAAGEKTKTVNVPVLDDAVDEGEETFLLRLSNATGARIGDGEATGTIANDDPLQKMWLSRFGRTVASHVTDAVSDRLANPLTGAQVTLGGQRVDLAAMEEDEAWVGEALTSVARALGASENREPEAGGWPETGRVQTDGPGGTSARGVTGRELLLGSAFHLTKEGERDGPGLAAWGRVAVGGFDGEAPANGGKLRIDGEVTTGILGADAAWNRMLAGVAISVSEGEGTFDQPGVDSGKIESSLTTVSPYARFMVNDRVSMWGLLGFGTGDMMIMQAANENQTERITRTDIEMRLIAGGGLGKLMEADEDGGIDLGLKADAFHVETEAQAVSNEGNTTGVASRVRLALEGGRAFELDGGVLTPGLEVGLRHDGGDAETGTGVELGASMSWSDPGTGLSMEALVRTLIAHEDSDYREWGASGSVRLAPGDRDRGLSFSLAPTYGAASSGVGRLWSARDARGLAPGGEFEPERRLEGELGYGLSVMGDRFTGTPNLGLGFSDSARDYRIGWRLTSAVKGHPGFEVNLDATRREPANDNGAGAGTGSEPEHGVMLRAAIRW